MEWSAPRLRKARAVAASPLPPPPGPRYTTHLDSSAPSPGFNLSLVRSAFVLGPVLSTGALGSQNGPAHQPPYGQIRIDTALRAIGRVGAFAHIRIPGGR